MENYKEYLEGITMYIRRIEMNKENKKIKNKPSNALKQKNYYVACIKRGRIIALKKLLRTHETKKLKYSVFKTSLFSSKSFYTRILLNPNILNFDLKASKIMRKKDPDDVAEYSILNIENNIKTSHPIQKYIQQDARIVRKKIPPRKMF
eukprot:gnl/TRDRNA2_/TRDRNA2_176772_c0_seq3.p1 gnl/TRDRNA2_/TRDRNA2_176772_c0~~gnl/TRDRNA2_/TRDRNA2_176772_c0_seq3.p1  ORF type:complete len:149 (+),score=4.29 gnl/TRDRNA2_/TRDRNA2_176772_c0_seq3:175-621(+)